MSAMLPRILLVEPQFVLRRTMVMVARDLGMVDFHEASSVGRARALLATGAYEGLVLDLQEGPLCHAARCAGGGAGGRRQPGERRTPAGP